MGRHDPLSLGNACDAISARCDLNPLTSPTWMLSGGIDAKVSSIKLGMALTFVAQNGPTTDQQPPFTWQSTSEQSLPHRGEPVVIDFPWTSFGPTAEFESTQLERETSWTLTIPIVQVLASCFAASIFGAFALVATSRAQITH